MVEDAGLKALARGSGIGPATAYRHLPPGIDDARPVLDE